MTKTPALDALLLDTLLPTQLAVALQSPSPPAEAIAEGCDRLKAVLDALASFASSPVVDLQLASPGRSRIDGMYLTGTIVYIDVSGFAQLSAELSMRGRHGNEELGTIVNRISAMLLEEIYDRGGGLVKFGGETYTAFFDKARTGEQHATQASAAALAMQARVAALAAEYANGRPLGLRIAVHVGRVFAVEVEDGGYAQLVVTGRAVHRAVGMQDVAASGEVIISEDTRQELGDAEVTPKFGGLFVLKQLRELPAKPPTPPAVWAPGQPSRETLVELLERIASLRRYVQQGLPPRYIRHSADSGEFRPVTVLFAKFYAFSNLLNLLELPALVEGDMSIIGRVLNTYYARTHTIIQRFGGNINKIDMAAFGDRMLAMFGAPAANEDDPTHAVQAALELRASLDDIRRAIRAEIEEWTDAHPEQRALLYVSVGPLRQRVGIASGTVFAGIVGTTRRREYTVIGEPVSRAARLLASAGDGEVLIAPATHFAVRHMLDDEPSVSGNRTPAGPPEAYRALRIRAGQSFDEPPAHATPLIGRQTEFAQLLEIADVALRAGDTSGRIVSLIGADGAGKSRLIAEALQRIRVSAPDVRILHEACYSYERDIPYAAIGRLLQRLLDLPADLDVAQTMIGPQLMELIPTWSRFAPLLGPLLQLPLSETDLTRAIKPEQRQERLAELLVQIFLAAAARAPLALVVDDLHSADASSLELLGQLAAELHGRRLLLVLAYHPHVITPEPWRQQEHATTIELGDLSPVEVELLLGKLLGGKTPGALQPLIEGMPGRPLFLEETVRYFQETGALTCDESGEWSYQAPAEASAPTQLEPLIVARIDRLPDDAREVLQLTAVIGQRFPISLLHAILPAASTERAIAELVAGEILAPDEYAGEPAYRFRHGLVRDIAYNNILFARRRELHAQVATAIEQLYAANLDNQRAVLAQHQLGAGRYDQAFAQLVPAARDAQARYANQEALSLYRSAIASAPWRDGRQPLDYSLALELGRNLAEVLARTGDFDGARQQYESLLSMLAHADLPEPSLIRAALQRRLGDTYERQGHLDSALLWYTRAAESVSAAATTPPAMLEHARLLSDTGWIHFRRRNLEQAQHDLEWALKLATAQGAFDELKQIYNRLGGVAWGHGDLASARYYVDQSLLASKRVGDISDQARALNNLGILSDYLGESDQAIQYGLRALEIYQQIGDRREAAIAAITTGYGLYNAARYDEAYTYLSQARGRAVEVRDAYLEMMALLNLGRVTLELEKWAELAEVLGHSQQLAEQMDMPSMQLECYVVLAEAALRRGDHELARREFVKAAALSIDDESEELARFRRLEARLALTAQEELRAIALFNDAEAMFTRLRITPEAKRTRRLLESVMVGDDLQ